MIAQNSSWASRLHRFRAALRWEIDKIARLINGVDKDSSPNLDGLYNRSTAIVGPDPFYLSVNSRFNGCSCKDVREVLERFAKQAFADGKVLILGNVPLEDSRTFNYPNRLARNPQVEECRTRIKEALA